MKVDGSEFQRDDDDLPNKQELQQGFKQKFILKIERGTKDKR